MERGVAAGRWTPLLLLAMLLNASNFVQGSHFRYGTMSWRPITSADTASGVTDADAIRRTVAFDFKAAYRRDYEWGKFFREQYQSSLPGAAWIDGGSCFTEASCSRVNSGDETKIFLFPETGVDYSNWKVKLAVGRSYFTLNVSAPNSFGETSDTRVQCVSPFDTGDKPRCADSDESNTQYAIRPVDPFTGLTIPYDPSYPDHVSDTQTPCEQADDEEPDYCSPWSQTYGLFFGDGTTHDVELTITEVNFENTEVGNFLLGQSVFYHTYAAYKKSDFEPWTVYFTGGNRLTYSTERLINNHQGRFRLELTVNLNYPDGVPNNSPILDSMPVLPVPYTGRAEFSANGMLATFSLQGYDPDINPAAYRGNKLESNERIYFYLASPRKMGMLLANQVPDLKFPSRWYKDDYELARQDCYERACTDAGGNFDPFTNDAGVSIGKKNADDSIYEGSCSQCAAGDRVCTSLRQTINGVIVETPLNFTCEAYPPWDNDKNHAHQPDNFRVNKYSGVAQWETGINPFQYDNASYVTDWVLDDDPLNDVATPGTIHKTKGTGAGSELQPLQPGFYNVVFDVRSASHDINCYDKDYQGPLINPNTGRAYTLPLNGARYTEDQCKAIDDEDMIDIAYVSTPIDFLLFLYQPASFCSKDICRNTVQGITTFRDAEGRYGEGDDPASATPAVLAGGKGTCTICGGGAWTWYDDTFTQWLTMTAQETNLTDYTVCLQDNNCGYSDLASILPADEALICKRNTPPKWVDQVIPGEPDGLTPAPRPADRPFQTRTFGQYIEDGVPAQNVYPGLALVTGQRSTEVRFNLTAIDEDDCVEMSILPVGLFRGYTMYELDTVGNPTDRTSCSYDDSVSAIDPQGNNGATCKYTMKLAYIKRVGSTNMFYREFIWEANTTLPQLQDPRPPNVVVCFLPFDNYQVGIRRCVNIILSSAQDLYWVDARAKLAEQFSDNTAFTDMVATCDANIKDPANTHIYENPCEYTPADLTTFYVSPGNTLEFYMTAIQDSGNAPLGIYITEGGMIKKNGQVGPPEGATFEYTEFPDGGDPDESFRRDPAKKKFSWTPAEGQQCEYKLCFIANNTRADPTTIDYSRTFGGQADERCYTIVVMDQVVSFMSGSFVDAGAVLPSLTSECGMTFSMWFYPEGILIMPVATFGYIKAGESTENVVYKVEWITKTKWQFSDGTQTLHEGEYRALRFTYGSFVAQTVVEFANRQWHYMAFTIAPDGAFTMYLDGVETTHYAEDMRDFHQVAVETGSLPVVDGEVEIVGGILAANPGSTPFLRLGAADRDDTNFYSGLIGDVRIYSRALPAEEIGAKMFVPLEATQEVGLEAYYKFSDGNQAANDLGNPLGQFNKYRALADVASADPDCNLEGDTYCNDANADSPTSPSVEFMIAKSATMMDHSGKGNNAVGCGNPADPADPLGCVTTSTMYFQFAPTPTMPPCPWKAAPYVVHVDGGAIITVRGVGFARSQWLKCSFSMSDGTTRVMKAQHVDNENIRCASPGSPDQTVSALEVTNAGAGYYTDFKIPVYMMERVVDFPEEGGRVVVPNACGNFGVYGFSIGGWLYPRSTSTGELESVMTLTGAAGYLAVKYNGEAFVVVEKVGTAAEVSLGESGLAPAHNSGKEGSGWHYVLLSGDDTKLMLYVDGAEYEMNKHTVSISVCDLELGTTSGKAFLGYMEEVTVWMTFLEKCDAYQLMWGNRTREALVPMGTGSTPTNPSSALVTYLKFNSWADPIALLELTDSSKTNTQGINLEGAASLLWTTVPYLKPSFNRPRPRVGPPVSKTAGMSTPVYIDDVEKTENATMPRKFQDFYQDAMFPGGELVPEEQRYGIKSAIKMQVDGRKTLNVVGFGFAESQWLKCDFNGELVPATFVNLDEVTCDIGPVETPGMYSLGVMNQFPDSDECEATIGTRSVGRGQAARQMTAELKDKLELSETALSLDGVDDYAISTEVAASLVKDGEFTGVTFGAWFKPMNDDADKSQPIMCFATKCEETVLSPPPPSPPPPSPPPQVCAGEVCPPVTPVVVASPPPIVSTPATPPAYSVVTEATEPHAQFCLMYKAGHVYLHSELTSPTYNDLYFNQSTAVPVTTGHWHYAEIVIDGKDTQLPEIDSELTDEAGNPVVPTFAASMVVDNRTYDGKPDGAYFNDFRVPVNAESLAEGTFYLGGLGCDPAWAANETPLTAFEGLVDEVRIFNSTHRTEWFARLDVEKEQPLAYYRMSSMEGESLNLYSLFPMGNKIEDFSDHGLHLTFHEMSTSTADKDGNQTHVFTEAPWEAASAFKVTDTSGSEIATMMLDADQTVLVEGYNVADTPWLKCIFYIADVSETKMVEIVPLDPVNATYVNGTHVSCKAPEAHMPIMGFAQIANPRGADAADFLYMDSALEFEGDMVKKMEIIGGTANAGESVDLTCPSGMRMDKVMFASYGRPHNRCNVKNETECDGTKTEVPCDYLKYEVNDECHSDMDKPPYWTIDRVEKICYGKESCTIPALDSVFGDPCPSKNKWLEVALRCSDRWTTKDYMQADDVTSQISSATGEYSVGLWVFPHSKPGVQAIVSFGAAPDSSTDILNNAILQWRGDEGGNTGRFYYYDDCVYDVLMKYADGRDIVVASHQWYQVWLTRAADGTMSMYLNGFLAATWTSVCAPAPGGTFILGMDLSDDMFPKEFFDGLMDEVVVYNVAVPEETIEKMMCWSNKHDILSDGLIAYYRFNRDDGPLALDESGNEFHGNLAMSLETLWQNNTLEKNGAFTDDATVAKIHTSYSFMGVPWFPTSTYSAHSLPGAQMEGELVGGQEVTVKGVNFVPRVSRVFYNDEEIAYEFVDMYTMTATIANLKDDPANTTAESVTYELSVVNALDTETCAAGDGTIQEEKVTYTQELGVRDLQDGLVCYFPFLGTPNDYAGQAKHGKLVGAWEQPYGLVRNRDSYPEQAYQFAEEDYIQIDGCIGRTVAMWIYYDDIERPVVHYSNVPFEAYEEDTGCQVSELATRNNAWLFVAGIMNDDMDLEKVYLNGEVSSNLKLREQVLSILFDKKIGGDGFKGKIDDVWIWDRELSQAEIVSQYHTNQYALEFGYGTEMSMEISTEAQGPPGLLARYFAYVMQEEVLEVMSQSYGDSAPVVIQSESGTSRFGTNNWAVELTGYIYAPYSQEYIFTIKADDVFRLWINKGAFTVDTEYETTTGSTPRHRYGPESMSEDQTDWVNVINEPCAVAACPEREVSGNIELTEGWYEIYMSYSDTSGPAGWSLEWQTTDGDITKQLIPKEYLRAGTGPTVMEAWVYPYEVDGDHTVVSQNYYGGLNGASIGIYQGGMYASVYVGCLAAGGLNDTKCDEYREVMSWKSPVVPKAWQHLYAAYDGDQWILYVDGLRTDSTNFRAYDTNSFSAKYRKFFAETRAPLVFGRDNMKEVIAGAPSDIRQYYGLIYSFAKWGKFRAPNLLCPIDGDENLFGKVGDLNGNFNDLLAYLMLNEGVGLTAYDQSGNGILQEYYMNAVITPPPSPLPLWVNATFEPRETSKGTFEVEGTVVGVVREGIAGESIAGKCAVFTISSFDTCRHKRMVGGDNYVVDITGPLHLNTETLTLSVGHGIEDMGDGSYRVSFTREVSGYYQIDVCIDNCEDTSVEQFKTYMHPYIADAGMSYIFDDLDDALYLDETNETMAGVPVEFTLQTVDMFGNLRTEGGITDWAFEINGPENFDGEWTDNKNGTYTFSYTAHVAGDYRYQVRMAGEAVCATGGNTCCGGTQSDYEYCTLAKTPEDPHSGGCHHCLTVHDGASLNFGTVSVPTVFPDMDVLDLDGNFTIYAYVKKGADSGQTREYILSKQSEYSGKGYWLALLPSPGMPGEYTLEGGVYVGSEIFRISRTLDPITLDPAQWAHVAMTYDGLNLNLYLDTRKVGAATFTDEPAKYGRRNAQPVRVGKDFAGQIDNVMMYSEVREPEHFAPDSNCPAFVRDMSHGPGPTEKLVAYYRFNEGDGYVTKDSSPLMNDGIIGLVCDSTAEGKTMHLDCPTGYQIIEVLYANFGDNDGSCGAYEMGECNYTGTMDIVNTTCRGQQSCVVTADMTTFANATCKSTTKSLAVNAVCGKPDDESDDENAGWKLDPAPTFVGQTVAAPEDIVCPFDLLEMGGPHWPMLPEWLHAEVTMLKNKGAQCSTADDLDHAVAGTPVVFALLAKDACGYRSMNASASAFQGSLKYPEMPNVTAHEIAPMASCVDAPHAGDFPPTPHNEIPFTVHNGTKVDGFCNGWGDTYVMVFTPGDDGEGTLELTLTVNRTEGPETMPVLPPMPTMIGWGALSSVTNVTGSGLTNAEAGVEAMFLVHAMDENGNLRMQTGDEDHIKVMVTGSSPAATRVTPSDKPGIYNAYIMYPEEGDYHVSVLVNSELVYEGDAKVHDMEVRPVTGLNLHFPEARFEHSMVSYDDELYIFGGARPDKTYLDSMLKYDTALGEFPALYSYRRKIEVENMVDEDFTVELTLDTAALIASGKLKGDCADLRFFNEDGAALSLWVEPTMSPGGCGSDKTKVWIRVPGGMDWFWMYYGNKDASSMSDPMSVFDFFEDFEYEASPLEMGWQLADTSTDTCTTEEGDHFGDAASFQTSTVSAMTGSRSLRADTIDKMGGSLFKAMPTMGKFTMKVFMYDMLCHGAHWVSPDFEACQPMPDMKTMLPSLNTGVGVYTASSEDHYCALYPWKTTGVEREVGWHSFTMRDNDEHLTVTYDAGGKSEAEVELRSDDMTTDISKVFIRAAQLPGDSAGSIALWDSIIVTPYNPDVEVHSSEEEFVNYNPEAKWEVVGSSSPPPARQAHTAVVYDDAMYVFGGERSAYEYSDVWKYEFEADEWAFQAPVNSSAELGRHDHSAVVYQDAMYVYGGRSPAPRDDFWKYDFKTKTWVPMPTSDLMHPRFGHGAAVSGDSMYVYGGYVSTEQGEGGLTDEIWEFNFEEEEWTKLGPRMENFERTVEDPADAIVFPQAIPSPRFPGQVLSTGMEPALYVVGGVGGESMMEELPELWKFDIEAKEWTLLAEHPLLARSDGAAALVGKGDFYKHVMLYGGHAHGKFLDDLVTMFVGETGTGDMHMDGEEMPEMSGEQTPEMSGPAMME
uniref:Uncharacterized protein n=1 Tax=Pyramimonas obovata TaxID=1411642 RepID=A0A7S0WPQ0_9CHLO|mmetsp:Transcript_33634/g.73407  ORF Transcript_33634/g.73407 Transcript_33634/m.73407 type:complete len:5079 (+) Transcript_33634:182-15418(+)